MKRQIYSLLFSFVVLSAISCSHIATTASPSSKAEVAATTAK